MREFRTGLPPHLRQKTTESSQIEHGNSVGNRNLGVSGNNQRSGRYPKELNDAVNDRRGRNFSSVNDSRSSINVNGALVHQPITLLPHQVHAVQLVGGSNLEGPIRSCNYLELMIELCYSGVRDVRACVPEVLG